MSAILEALAAGGSVQVADLARRFEVSEATLRRDLSLLEQQRLLTRVHGGAVAQDVAYELPVRYRDGQHSAAKRAIAKLAVASLSDADHVVGLTGGTTTSEVARQLPAEGDLTVVTNALNIAMDLVLRPRVKLIVVGGVSRPQSYELVGPWADEVMRSINIGTAFVGVDGISAAGGLTTHDEIEARTNHAMISRAQRVVVVADGTKVGRVTLARMADLAKVDELFTDDSADGAQIDSLRAAGVKVSIAVTNET
ncbi:MAG: DeoR family transcriptional regulator, aga operon transcriptional repressor [Nocardioidaceae bacterium]|jgi:DeoR family transcriptional regulator of aga operon|nr:DeoR family transcriptional regulator, aga operon transcriptional repressor [Nocardioidaceae bacterium]